MEDRTIVAERGHPELSDWSWYLRRDLGEGGEGLAERERGSRTLAWSILQAVSEKWYVRVADLEIAPERPLKSSWKLRDNFGTRVPESGWPERFNMAEKKIDLVMYCA